MSVSDQAAAAIGKFAPITFSSRALPVVGKGRVVLLFQSFHILPPSNSDEQFLPYNLEVGGVRFAFWNGNVFN